MGEEIGVHVLRQGLHQFKRLDPGFRIHIWLCSAFLEVGPAESEENVVEFLGKIPARGIGAANRVIHDALITNHLGG